MSSVMDIIQNRRSVRRFKDAPVEDEKILLLLEAAMAAPSAKNKQPWEFVVLNEKQGIEALKEHLPFGKYNAPLVIVVCGKPEKAFSYADGGNFWEQDCSLAAENILIAAAGLDLGGVWTAIHPSQTIVPAVRKQLGIPESIIPLCALMIGYPAESLPPRTQYDNSKVHWQRY